MITKEQRLFIDRAMKVVRWRMDVDSGEMIEQRKDGEQYCKDYLSVKGSISQRNLAGICATVNEVFYQSGSDLMVGNSMGEFIPSTAKPHHSDEQKEDN